MTEDVIRRFAECDETYLFDMVTGDMNLDDGHAEYCLEVAKIHGESEEIVRLAELLVRMSPTQRSVLEDRVSRWTLARNARLSSTPWLFKPRLGEMTLAPVLNW